MATRPVKLKLLPRSTMKAKVATRLTGQVVAGTGISVTKAAGVFTVAVDLADSAIVTGPAVATDNAIARFDGTDGTVLQNSVVTISDTGILAGGAWNGTVGVTARDTGAFTFLGVGAAAPSSTTAPVQITTAAAAAFIGQTNSNSTWLSGPTTAFGTTGKGWGLFSNTLNQYALTFDDSNVATFGYSTLSGAVLKLQNSSGTATFTPTATATFTLPNASGTVAVSASAPLVLNTITGNLTITGAAGQVLAGATPAFTAQPVLGAVGNGGTLGFAGSISGTVTIVAQAATGAPALTLPNGSGTFAVSASSPLVLNATTGNLTVTAAALTKTDDTNVTLTLGGTPTTALLAATSLTLGWTGTLAVARGGTGNSALAALTKTDDTNVTLTLGGSPTTALVNATSLTLGWTGQLGLTRGGTAASLTASTGGIVYSGASALAILSGTATARQMLQSGASASPAWSTTTWPATTTINRLLWSSAANVISDLATANSSILVTDSGGIPSLSTTLPAHTLGGTISGGGNQINNVIIGASTPLAGAFTTLSASGLISANGGQIAFPASQSASADANTLDDYEEGTWTPVLTFATPGDVSVAYILQTGVYTKIGRSILVGWVIVTSAFTHTTASGAMTITGLPFTSANVSNQIAIAGMEWAGITKTNYTSVAPVVSPNTSTVTFNASGSAQALSTVVAADTPTGGTVILAGQIFYVT